METDAALTRCPACQTVFAVGSEDLARAGGRVRCGDCLGVFDALANALPAESIDTVTPSASEAADEQGAADGSETSLNWTLLEPVPVSGSDTASEDPAAADTGDPTPDTDAQPHTGAEMDPTSATAHDGKATPEHPPQTTLTLTDDNDGVPDAERDSTPDESVTVPDESITAPEATADETGSDDETAGQAHAFRFGDDTPPEMLQAELDALSTGDSGTYREPPATSGEIDFDLTATMSDVGDADLFEDDWDDLLSELGDAEPVAMTLIDDDSAESPPLDFQLVEQDTAASATSVDLDLSRADDALSAPEAIEALTLAANTDYRAAPDFTAQDVAMSADDAPAAIGATAAADTASSQADDTAATADDAQARAGDRAIQAGDPAAADASDGDVRDANEETADAAALAGSDDDAEIPDAAAFGFDPAAVSDILSAREALMVTGETGAADVSAETTGDRDAGTDPAGAGEQHAEGAAGAENADDTQRDPAADTDKAGDMQPAAIGATAPQQDAAITAAGAGAAARDDDAGDGADALAARTEAAAMAELQAAIASGEGEVIVLSGDGPAAEDDEFAASMILSAPPRPARRRLWAGLSALALFALAIQALHGFRGTIATTAPWGSYLSDAYALLGQPIVPRWDATQMCVERSGGALAADNVLDIETVFSNHGDRTMPMPMLKLRITDAYSDTLAGIVIAPDDYLPDTDPRRELRPGEQATAIATLDYAEPRLDGFEVSLCYPGDGDRLRCALRCGDQRARR